MDMAAAVKVAKMAKKIGGKIMRYVRDDNAHAYGLDEAVSVVLAGEGVSPFWPEAEIEFTTADGSLTIAISSPSRAILRANPFPAGAKLWNGPDLLPDTQYRSMLASLFHDLIWVHRRELAEAFGRDEQSVLAWGNDVLYTIWVWASGNAVQRLEARLAWHVCDLAAPWYHSAKKILRLGCIAALAATMAGCASPPTWTVESADGTNAVVRAMQAPAATQVSTPSGAGDTLPPSGSEGGGSSQGAGVLAPDAVAFSALDWCWGGFQGGKAKAVDGCRIGSLEVSSSGLSYSWEAGGCERLGAASETDYSHTVCALFCRVGGKWRGGKFDWISTSRRTRDLKNCMEGYGGWDKDAVGQADAYAFVVVSKDGRRRSNVAVAEGRAK